MAPHTLRPPAEEAEAIETFLAEEGIAPGSRLLDAPCGIGRRASALAARGFRVVAVDPNDVGVEAAKARVPPNLRPSLRFGTAPLERLPDLGEDERFDAILCLDHALGRGDASAEGAMLARLRPHLAPGGRLIVDLLHRDFFALRPRPFSFHVIGSIEQHEFRSFDPRTGILDLTWKFYEREGEDLKHRADASTTMRLLTPHQAESLLESAGWHVAALYGGWGREAVSAERRKLVLVARPAARG